MAIPRTATQPRRIKTTFPAACILAFFSIVLGTPAFAQQNPESGTEKYLDEQDDGAIATLSTGEVDWALMPTSPEIDAETRRYTAIFETLQEANDAAIRRPGGAWKAPSDARGADLLVLLAQCRHHEHVAISRIAGSLDHIEWTADHERLWERRSALTRIASLIDSQMDRPTQAALIETYGAIPRSTTSLAQEEETLRAAFGDEYFDPEIPIEGYSPERDYDPSNAEKIAETNFSQRCLLLAAGIR